MTTKVTVNRRPNNRDHNHAGSHILSKFGGSGTDKLKMG